MSATTYHFVFGSHDGTEETGEGATQTAAAADLVQKLGESAPMNLNHNLQRMIALSTGSMVCGRYHLFATCSK